MIWRNTGSGSEELESLIDLVRCVEEAEIACLIKQVRLWNGRCRCAARARLTSALSRLPLVGAGIAPLPGLRPLEGSTASSTR